MSVVEITPTVLRPTLGRRLQHQDANGVDVIVGIQPRIGALHGPVVGGVVSFIAGWVLVPGEGGGNTAWTDKPIRIAFPLVEAGSADQAKRRAFGQVRR